MKKFTIEKLPSGNYRVRRAYAGRRITMIFEEKPTQKECEEKWHREMNEPTCNEFRSFNECAEAYIKSKDGILSVTSLYSYRLMLNVIPDQFKKIPLAYIKQFDIQMMLNTYAKKHKPKTVKNLSSFVLSVIKLFIPNFYAKITLPKPTKEKPYIPNDEDIKKLFEIIKDSELEIPCALACFGLRRGEIAALTPSDFKEDRVIINKSMAVVNGHELIIKDPKTYDSTREVILPITVIKKVKEKGCVWTKNPMRMQKILSRIEAKNNLPHFSLHKLRHYYASISHMLRPDIITKQEGGWKSDVLQKVYQHKISSQYDNVVVDHFNAILTHN